MGEYADDEIDRWIGDSNWGRRYVSHSTTPPKQKNSQVFAKFARDGTNFKTGDRVVHIPSGEAGVVWATRGHQILWRPDGSIKSGAIYVDSAKFRFDI